MSEYRMANLDFFGCLNLYVVEAIIVHFWFRYVMTSFSSHCSGVWDVPDVLALQQLLHSISTAPVVTTVDSPLLSFNETSELLQIFAFTELWSFLGGVKHCSVDKLLKPVISSVRVLVLTNYCVCTWRDLNTARNSWESGVDFLFVFSYY